MSKKVDTRRTKSRIIYRRRPGRHWRRSSPASAQCANDESPRKCRCTVARHGGGSDGAATDSSYGQFIFETTSHHSTEEVGDNEAEYGGNDGEACGNFFIENVYNDKLDEVLRGGR